MRSHKSSRISETGLQRSWQNASSDTLKQGCVTDPDKAQQYDLYQRQRTENVSSTASPPPSYESSIGGGFQSNFNCTQPLLSNYQQQLVQYNINFSPFSSTPPFLLNYGTSQQSGPFFKPVIEPSQPAKAFTNLSSNVISPTTISNVTSGQRLSVSNYTVGSVPCTSHSSFETLNAEGSLVSKNRSLTHKPSQFTQLPDVFRNVIPSYPKSATCAMANVTAAGYHKKLPSSQFQQTKSRGLSASENTGEKRKRKYTKRKKLPTKKVYKFSVYTPKTPITTNEQVQVSNHASKNFDRSLFEDVCKIWQENTPEGPSSPHLTIANETHCPDKQTNEGREKFKPRTQETSRAGGFQATYSCRNENLKKVSTALEQQHTEDSDDSNNSLRRFVKISPLSVSSNSGSFVSAVPKKKKAFPRIRLFPPRRKRLSRLWEEPDADDFDSLETSEVPEMQHITSFKDNKNKITEKEYEFKTPALCNAACKDSSTTSQTKSDKVTADIFHELGTLTPEQLALVGDKLRKCDFSEATVEKMLSLLRSTLPAMETDVRSVRKSHSKRSVFSPVNEEDEDRSFPEIKGRDLSTIKTDVAELMLSGAVDSTEEHRDTDDNYQKMPISDNGSNNDVTSQEENACRSPCRIQEKELCTIIINATENDSGSVQSSESIADVQLDSPSFKPGLLVNPNLQLKAAIPRKRPVLKAKNTARISVFSSDKNPETEGIFKFISKNLRRLELRQSAEPFLYRSSECKVKLAKFQARNSPLLRCRDCSVILGDVFSLRQNVDFLTRRSFTKR